MAMHSELTRINDTKIKLTISATATDLAEYKDTVLKKLARDVRLQGFRQGKAPLALVEKSIDQNILQTEFLDLAMTELYIKAAAAEKVRPVTRPAVSVKKFVPFTNLEFEVTTEVVGTLKLADYKKIKLAKPKAEVSAKDVNDVINSLKLRIAEKKEVDRAAKKNDEVWIDFKGEDLQGKPVAGADGKDYPLVIGSNTFIPGFEDNVIGLKVGDEKSFTLTFPQDYGAKALAGQKVKFTVTVKNVKEVVEPAIDDAFAAKVGPFKSLKDLKDDIKKQLTAEKQNEINRQYSSDLVEKIADKSTVKLPDTMIDQQVEHNLREFTQNLAYRGQTLKEFVESEGTTEEKYRKEVLVPEAEKQVKASLILAEIAEQENLSVTPEELEIRIQILKGQYQDPQMHTELDKPENRQDIGSRLLTEKVLAKLEEYAK